MNTHLFKKLNSNNYEHTSKQHFMKNKGRRHKSGRGPYANGNCKGALCGITRSIEKMGSRNNQENSQGSSKKFLKRKWSKRVRGYFKSQTKCIHGSI